MLFPATGEGGREGDHFSPLSSLFLSHSLTHQIQREINIAICCCSICKPMHFIYSSFVCWFMCSVLFFCFFVVALSHSSFFLFFHVYFKITHSRFYSTSDCLQLVHTVHVICPFPSNYTHLHTPTLLPISEPEYIYCMSMAAITSWKFTVKCNITQNKNK